MGKKILIGVVIFLTIILYGLSWSLWESTIVEVWVPWTVGIGLSLLTGIYTWKMWRGLTDTDIFWVNYLVNLVFFCSVFQSLMFGVNKIFADDSTIHQERVVVERKLRQERHKTRRVGRRSYSTGEVYYVYYMDVRFRNGKRKKLPVSFSYYRKLHKGDSINLEVEQGLLDMPVINRKGKVKDVPPSKRDTPPNLFKPRSHKSVSLSML